MDTIVVNASTSYKVIIDKNILAKAGEIAASEIGVCNCVVVTDTTVDALYSEVLVKSLESAGYNVSKFVFEAGERSKNSITLINILEFLAEVGLTRSDCVFALGGGVVGDIAGFAASIYLRGIRFVQIPTTLLAMVDSSVGGKTGIDLRSGKNLAGTFHQPALVICDCDVLRTLTSKTFSDGMAEIIKYAIIDDKPLFDKISKSDKTTIKEIISACIKKKATIVMNDEFDKGCRQLLNLGHTIGHAIEKCSDFSVSHGSAISIGMVIVTKAAINSGMCEPSAINELTEILKANNLPTECPFTATELAKVALSDKKRKGDTITLAIPYNIGNTKLVDFDVTELEALIERGLT